MDIKDLRARQGNIEVTAIVVDKSTPRDFDKNGNKGKVCNARIKDDSGSISLTLWNDEVDKVGVGDKIKITNGYANEWQGELQLSAGKFGKIDIVEKGAEKPKEIKQPENPEVFKNFSEEETESNEDFDVDEEDVF